MIFVTGGNGFLGRAVCRALLDRGFNSWAPTSAELDLLRHNDVSSTVWRKHCEQGIPCIIHLAADCGGIGYNRTYPYRLWHDNLAMGLTVLNLAIALDLPLVMVGTTCSYPKMCPVPFREDDIWNGYPEETNAPYGIAKRALLAGFLAAKAGLALYRGAYLILANLYGPGDKIDRRAHVIPDLFRKVVAAEGRGTLNLMGDGSPTRDFLWVDDAAEAIAMAAQRSINGRLDMPVLNIGTGVETSISSLAKLVQRVMGVELPIRWHPNQPGGQPRRALDTTRAKEVLGWKARTPLIRGLELLAKEYSSGSGSRASLDTKAGSVPPCEEGTSTPTTRKRAGRGKRMPATSSRKR